MNKYLLWNGNVILAHFPEQFHTREDDETEGIFRARHPIVVMIFTLCDPFVPNIVTEEGTIPGGARGWFPFDGEGVVVYNGNL